MIKGLTIAYITSRKKPEFGWFYDSLINQIGDTKLDLIQVNSNLSLADVNTSDVRGTLGKLKVTAPKPSVWQGKYRITKEDWWAKSNAMNTAICLCETDFIAFVDDRCVLSDKWLSCVKEAMIQPYAVCGSYEKRANMKVENGIIVDEGELLGIDTRAQNGLERTRDWYGGSCALPLEWCLAVNGYDEKMCDSLGSEDSMFGVTLRNNNMPMYFDSRMRIIEDRTPSEIDGALKRADKNVHLGQNAKSWAIVKAFHGKLTSQNDYDIRNLRDRILLNHEEFPPPVPMHYDWYDGQSLAEME